MLRKYFLNSDFTRNTVILVSGAAIAQAIPIILQLILRRTYSPQDFGAFSVYMVLLSPLALIATLRYEVTIVLPKENQDSANILVGSILINLVLIIIIFIIIILFKDNLVSFINLPEKYSYYLYFLPLGIFLYATYQSINFWLIRQKAFKSSATNKIMRRVAEGVTQIIFGVFKQPFGLIIGDLIGNCANNISGIRQLVKNNFIKSDITKERIYSVLKKYSSFPKYNLVPAVLDSLTIAFPVLFINKFFSTDHAGYFDLTQMALVAPLSLISATISQVLLQNISEKKNKLVSIKRNIIKLTLLLSVIGIFTTIIILLFGTELFSFVFGEKWKLSGDYSKILIFCYIVRFIISPISIVLISLEKIKMLSLWQILYFLLISSLVFFSYFTIEQFIKLYVIFNVAAYLVYAILITLIIREYEKNIIKN